MKFHIKECVRYEVLVMVKGPYHMFSLYLFDLPLIPLHLFTAAKTSNFSHVF